MHEVKQNRSRLPAAEPGLLIAGLGFCKFVICGRPHRFPPSVTSDMIDY